MAKMAMAGKGNPGGVPPGGGGGVPWAKVVSEIKRDANNPKGVRKLFM